MSVKEFIKHQYRHFNAAVVVDRYMFSHVVNAFVNRPVRQFFVGEAVLYVATITKWFVI